MECGSAARCVTYIRVFADLVDDGLVEGTGVTGQPALDVVGVLETSQGLNVVNDSSLLQERHLASLAELGDLLVVDVGYPALVFGHLRSLDVLLEDNDVVVGDRMLSRAR